MTFFRTARLDVRRFTAADAGAFTAYRADPQVARYQSWDHFDLAQGEALIASMRHLELGTPGGWLQLALQDRARGALVGDLACKVDASEPREMEIGFTIAPDHQGFGYATEAVQALLHHAFDQLDLHRVVAVTDARNTAAAAVLGRVGMRQEAHLIDNVWFKGAWGSELLFAQLSREHRHQTKHAGRQPAPHPRPFPGGAR